MKTEVLSIAHTLVISGISCFSNDLHFKNLKYILSNIVFLRYCSHKSYNITVLKLFGSNIINREEHQKEINQLLTIDRFGNSFCIFLTKYLKHEIEKDPKQLAYSLQNSKQV